MPSSEQAASVLNIWLGSSFYYYWPRGRDYSLQALIDNVVYSIDAGYPVIVNLKIDPEDPHPPNYPWRSGPIYHHVTVVGYSDSGNTFCVLDPAAEGGANGVLPDDWNNVRREWDWSATLISDMMYTGCAAGDYPDFVAGAGAGAAKGVIPPPPDGSTNPPTPPPTSSAVKHNDYNRDGVSDLVGVRKSDGYLVRWTGNGNGGFTYIGDWGGGWSNYTGLT